jgi:protease-4
VFDVSSGVPEQPPQGLLGVASHKQSLDELLSEIERAGKDKDFKGALVRFGDTSIGLAKATELAEALLELGKKGKPIYCHADGYTNATFYAAVRACSKIFVSPVGEVEAIGLAAQVVYMHRLLADRLNLTIDFLQVGKFKGADEPLTRDGPSDEARASLEGTLADMRESWLEGVRQRGAEVAGVIEDGPYSPNRAKELKLVDEVAYVDDAKDALKKAVSAVRDEVRFGPGSGDASGGDFADLVRILAGEGGGGAPVALVRATGSISMRGGGGLFGGSGGITERDLGKTLARIEKDDDIKALVLRIDSPGGSALASDLLWHQLMKIRAKKPVVVSVGDMAASGGYYLASTGNVIFADATSIVGSIGVVGGKIAVSKALEEIGVHAETFPARRGDPRAASRAGYLSPLVPWDEPTRARVLETMTNVYDVFLARVAEGRKLPVAKIAESAEGRIFSGREGKARGLVDEIGGLSAAIVRARELAKLAPDARVAVVGRKSGLLDTLAGSADDVDGETGGRAPSIGVLDLVERVTPELAPFAGSLLPLLQGERSLAAVPFAMVLR